MIARVLVYEQRCDVDAPPLSVLYVAINPRPTAAIPVAILSSLTGPVPRAALHTRKTVERPINTDRFLIERESGSETTLTPTEAVVLLTPQKQLHACQ